jgi:D-alanyl-D-alanine carboxypeptidase
MIGREPARFWKVTALVCAVAMVASGCGASEVQPTTTPDPSPVQRADFQQALVELVPGESNGAIALVEAPEGTWRGATGRSSGDRPAEPGDRYGIGSTTKTFVATVVLQLVGEGRLFLDDTVEKWLPGQVNEGDRITIRQLLNHTSGIAMGFGLPPPDSQRPLLAEPGTEHHYSNTNYEILGLIVEGLTGSSLDVVVLDRIFRPLRLEDSSYGSVSLGNEADLPAWLGAKEEGSGPVSGSGGIASTAADQATFFRALVSGELLDEAELSEMLRTVDTGTDPLATAPPVPARAGLGIFEFKLPCGSAWGHAGDYPSYSNQVLVARDASKVVVVAQNKSGWPRAQATAVEMYCG